jgi:hypothetical protein
MPANPAPAVIDGLTSTSTTDALSANQGRVLNEKIEKISIVNNTAIDSVEFSRTSDGRVAIKFNEDNAPGTDVKQIVIASNSIRVDCFNGTQKSVSLA